MTIELTASMIVPTVITDAMLISCTTPEPAAGETAWNAATSYTVGQVVYRATTHRLYENLIAGINATTPETVVSPARWLDIGPTNRWAQFDKKIGTATTSTGDLTIVIKPGSAEGLALLDLVGRTATVSVKTYTGGATVYSRTIDLDGSIVTSVYDWMFTDFVQKRNALLTDLPGQYPSMEVTATVASTTGSAVGVLAIGRASTIGTTEYGAGAGIINFGKVADDGFGNRTWIEGEWANRVTLPLIANTSDFNRLHRQLATVRSTPCIYIGSSLDSMEPLVVYGVYRDLYITVPNYPTISLNLEIDGMNNSQKDCMALSPLPALDRTSATFKSDLDNYFLTSLPAFSVDAEALRVEVNAKEATAVSASGTAVSSAALTAADRVQTGLDRVQTGLDRAQTAADRAVVEGIAVTAGVASVNGATGAVTGIADLTTAQTLTNKTISLGSNTVSGTIAQFNTACTDADFVIASSYATSTTGGTLKVRLNGTSAYFTINGSSA